MQKPGCLSTSIEYKTLNKMAVREAMVRLYDVLNQFVDDGGPKWADSFYKQVTAYELENTVEAVSRNDVSPLYHKRTDRC